MTEINLNYTTKERMQEVKAMEYVGAYNRMKEHEKRVRDAAQMILEVSNELHLTWSEFEAAIQTVKKISVLSPRGSR